MISTVGQKPVLKVGNHYISSYDVTWLSMALDQASRSSNGEVLPFRDDLIHGIKVYLESLCSLHVLPIEELFTKIKEMLRQIGLHAIADHLKVNTPPFIMDLGALAQECPLPLFFYTQLRSELRDLCHSGVSSCTFSGLRECVLTLENTTHWNSLCDIRLQEITLFIRNLWADEQSPLFAYTQYP